MTVQSLEHNKAIISDWIDRVFNEKDMTAIKELKELSYLDWTPFPTQRPDLPISGLIESLPVFLNSLPDFHFKADELIAEGDLVVCLGSWNATYKNDYMGVAATGNQIGGTRIDIFRVSGEKMVEHWGCGGELGFLGVMGALKNGAPAVKDNKTIAREFVEQVFNHRNLGAIEELVDDYAADYTNQSLAAFFVLTAFPDFNLQVEQVLAEGDNVTVLSSFSGTHRGAFLNIAPTGKQVSGTRTDTFRIVDGKIVESWQDWDRAGLAAQLSA